MSFEDFVKRTIRALSEAGLEYVIVGGVAAIIHGRIRSTVDLDVVIRLNPSDASTVKKLASAFRRNDLDVLEHEIISSLKEKSHFSVFDTRSPLRVDAKGVYTSLDSMALENRKETEILGLKVWVASPEDVIIGKLTYGSPQDIEDAASIILNLRDELDYEYLNQQAKKRKVYKRFKELLKNLK